VGWERKPGLAALLERVPDGLADGLFVHAKETVGDPK